MGQNTDFRPLFSTNPPSARVTSFDDVPYIFGEPLRYPERFSLEDISITKMMMNLITSFVKTGFVLLLLSLILFFKR